MSLHTCLTSIGSEAESKYQYFGASFEAYIGKSQSPNQPKINHSATLKGTVEEKLVILKYIYVFVSMTFLAVVLTGAP